jgi:hypothetical protein
MGISANEIIICKKNGIKNADFQSNLFKKGEVVETQIIMEFHSRWISSPEVLRAASFPKGGPYVPAYDLVDSLVAGSYFVSITRRFGLGRGISHQADFPGHHLSSGGLGRPGL